MKTPVSLVLAACALLAACAPESGREVQAASVDGQTRMPEGANPIVGAWELIHGEYDAAAGNTQVRDSGRPFQLKLFTPAHFAYAMRNEDGSFSEAAAGTYRLEGGTYTETHTYQSHPEYVGFVATWNYRVSGDTLFMEGPTQVLDAAGNPLAEPVPLMKEIRVRAR